MNDLLLPLNVVLSLSDVLLGSIQMLGKHLFLVHANNVVRFRDLRTWARGIRHTIEKTITVQSVGTRISRADTCRPHAMSDQRLKTNVTRLRCQSQGRLVLATTVWIVRALTLLLEQFVHCPEQPCSPHPKLHVYRPPKPQAF